jgi:NitT/TauT family transport system substrate-binding protein
MMTHDLQTASISRSAAMAVIGGGILAAANPVAAQTALAPVRMGAPTIDASAAPFFGADAGIFQANGIDPQVTVMANAQAIVQAVLAGALDTGLANPMVLAVAMSRGIPLQVLATGSLYSKRDAVPSLVVAKDAPFKTAKDLIGASIGDVSLGNFNQISMMAWLEANGVPAKSVKFVELPFSEVGEALKRGTVQAAFLAEPFESAQIRAGLIRQFGDPYITVGPEICIVAWFSTKDWVQKNPDVAKRLIKGIYATGKWSNAHTAETAAILARVSKQDVAGITAAKRYYWATEERRQYLEPILKVASQYGALQRPVSYEEFLGG